MVFQNLHTHTEFCDGRNSMEEMVQSAIERGFASVGFSPHSYMPFDTETGMSPQEDCAYRMEVKRLKEKYNGVIQIYQGLEFERYSEHKIVDYDYVIGSSHFLKLDGEIVLVDTSAINTKKVIDTYFGADSVRFAKKYFETLCELGDIYPFDIIGHFDVITKNEQEMHLIDTDSKLYRKYALEAVHTLFEKTKIFEVNTGVMARSGRKTPYPDKFILEELNKIGAYVTIGSDCHRADQFGVGHKEAMQLIKECGFDEIMIFDGSEFCPVAI